MAKKKDAGLLIIIRIAGRSVAVLQRIGQLDFKHLCRSSQPYNGGCRLTAVGRLKGEENYEAALARVVQEQLGSEFSEALLAKQPGAAFDDGSIKVLGFFLRDPALLKLIRLGPDSGGLVLVSQEGDGDDSVYSFSQIRALRNEDSGGVRPGRDLALFLEEFQIVREALSMPWPK